MTKKQLHYTFIDGVFEDSISHGLHTGNHGSRGRGVHRAMKPDRVTRNQSTPTQSHHSMSPIADSSRVFEASEKELQHVLVALFEGDLSTMVAEREVFIKERKRDRVTSKKPTPIQSPNSMSPIADSSRVFKANEKVPDTR
ncbi:hypothetical protein Tco_0281211, partial [Tanacetum coccineum]